jgi:hypothetical protein
MRADSSSPPRSQARPLAIFDRPRTLSVVAHADRVAQIPLALLPVRRRRAPLLWLTVPLTDGSGYRDAGLTVTYTMPVSHQRDRARESRGRSGAAGAELIVHDPVAARPGSWRATLPFSRGNSESKKAARPAPTHRSSLMTRFTSAFRAPRRSHPRWRTIRRAKNNRIVRVVVIALGINYAPLIFLVTQLFDYSASQRLTCRCRKDLQCMEKFAGGLE